MADVRCPRDPSASPHPVVQLDNGELGYCMRDDRVDDCFRAALATATQIPVDEVPDPQIGRRLAEGGAPEAVARESWGMIVRWLDGRGLVLWYHEDVPVERGRWVGVCVPSRERAGVDPLLEPGEREQPFPHCLVLDGGGLVFDPATGLSAGDMQPRPWLLSEIAYGLTIEPKGGG